MSVATTTALAIGGVAAAGIGAGGSILAGSEQAGAANNAASLQAQDAQNALNFQEQEFNTKQGEQKPFLKGGTKAVNSLSALPSTPGKGLLTPYSQTFQAPTAAQAAATP